jgi:hypothetical protein
MTKAAGHEGGGGQGGLRRRPRADHRGAESRALRDRRAYKDSSEEPSPGGASRSDTCYHYEMNILNIKGSAAPVPYSCYGPVSATLRILCTSSTHWLETARAFGIRTGPEVPDGEVIRDFDPNHICDINKIIDAWLPLT